MGIDDGRRGSDMEPIKIEVTSSECWCGDDDCGFKNATFRFTQGGETLHVGEVNLTYHIPTLDYLWIINDILEQVGEMLGTKIVLTWDEDGEDDDEGYPF